MTHLNIKLNVEELTEAVMKSDMQDMMKYMAVTVFNAYMESERDAHVNAARKSKGGGRLDMRNGYYDRDYTMAVGKINLRVPRTRSGEFSTQIFEKYQRMDQALVLTLQEAVISGVSTRKVTKLVESLCGEEVSKSFVSDTVARIQPEIDDFKGRLLNLKTYRYLYVDAMYIKVREDHRVVSKAVYIAQAVNADNFREIVGFMVSDAESETGWATFFQNMKDRGLVQPRLIISDAHSGLKAAIQKEFVGAAWQRCTVHFMRNIFQTFPKKDNADAKGILKKLFKSPTRAHALANKAEFEALAAADARFGAALETLDAGFEDAMQYLAEPQPYHVSLRTTNSLERINREVRRRERVIGIFPNAASAERLLGAVLMDVHASLGTPGRRMFMRNDIYSGQ